MIFKWFRKKEATSQPQENAVKIVIHWSSGKASTHYTTEDIKNELLWSCHGKDSVSRQTVPGVEPFSRSYLCGVDGYFDTAINYKHIEFIECFKVVIR